MLSHAPDPSPQVPQLRSLFPGEHECQHCGWIGRDVQSQIVHIGGKGLTVVWYCREQRPCWARWAAGQAG